MEVEMKIRGLMMDPITNMPIVILKDSSSNSVLPIWVGIYEANAIALEIEKVSTPRPMTHDLIKTLLMGFEAGIRKVVVNELRDDTFYAVIWVERNGELISVDSRPSDALALALRLDCPIYVDETVLKSARQSANVSDKLNTNQELRRLLENLGDEDFGRYKMQSGLSPRLQCQDFHFKTLKEPCLQNAGDGLQLFFQPRPDDRKAHVQNEISALCDHRAVLALAQPQHDFARARSEQRPLNRRQRRRMDLHRNREFHTQPRHAL